MTTHDPLCWRSHRPDLSGLLCDCDLIASVVEREETQAAKAHREILGRYIAHAEQVAARLVEVIVQDNVNLVWAHRWRQDAEAARDHYEEQRDAARAEIAALRRELGYAEREAAAVALREREDRENG